MSTQKYLDKILPILAAVREDEAQLKKILDFLEDEILPAIEQKEDEEAAPIAIPPQFEPLVNGIAQSLECGLVCFLNADTLETEEIPNSFLEDAMFDLDEEEQKEFGEDYTLKHKQWEHVISFEPMASFEGFRIMEDFAGQMKDSRAKNRMTDILNRKKPFAHFNEYIHNSPYREDWFAFKTAAYEKYVRGVIERALREEDEAGE